MSLCACVLSVASVAVSRCSPLELGWEPPAAGRPALLRPRPFRLGGGKNLSDDYIRRRKCAGKTRMARLTEGMLRDMREGTEQGDSKILSLVTERDDEVDRLYFLLVRALRTATINPELAEKFRLTPVECLDYRVLASFLESLGDSIAELARRMQDESPTKQFVKNFNLMLNTLEEMEEVVIRSFLERRVNRSRGAYLEIETMEREVAELSSKTAQMSGISTGAVVDILSLVERIAKIFKDISDLSLPTYAFQR